MLYYLHDKYLHWEVSIIAVITVYIRELFFIVRDLRTEKLCHKKNVYENIIFTRDCSAESFFLPADLCFVSCSIRPEGHQSRGKI